MNLRSRLLLLMTPLTLLPLIFVTFLLLFLFEKFNPGAFPLYKGIALLFLLVMLGATITMVIIVSNWISVPLRLLTKASQKIADGDFDFDISGEPLTAEAAALSSAVERLKNEIRRHEELAKQLAADAATGKLASHVAHDMASPLASLQAAAEHFKRTAPASARSDDYITLLEMSVMRLKRIASDLLERRTAEPPEHIIFSVHRILDELIGEYQAQEMFNCLEFRKEYAKQSIFLYGERNLIQRSFGNITKNAIEAMDKCGTLTARTKLRGEKVIIEIEDTGPGMTPELLERVLRGGVTADKKDGHGIGLTVVRKTVEEHHGKVEASSRLGVGTTFHLTFPLPDAEVIKHAEKEEGFVELFTVQVKRNETVIVIDDDASVCEQWTSIFERSQVPVLTFKSYEDYRERKPAGFDSTVAIVDHSFFNSTLNGFEIISKLEGEGFQRFYLCTVDYWKPVMQRLAKDYRVPLCPKPLPRIRVEQEESRPPVIAIKRTQGPRVLVIDDDPGIRLTWKAMKEQMRIGALELYGSMEECETARIDYASIDLAFIDRHIVGSEWDLPKTISYLKKHGVKKVIVASGDPANVVNRSGECDLADGIAPEKIPESLEAFV